LEVKYKYAFLFVALMLAGCGQQSAPVADEHAGEDEHTDTVDLSADAQEIAGVKVATVERRMMQPSYAFTGVVKSTTTGRAVVTSPVAGRIVRITVTLGQHVRAGQTVAVIESSELAEAWSEIASAESERSNAEAALQHAKAETKLTKSRLDSSEDSLKRLIQLAEAGAFSQAPLQAALNELNDAQSDLQAAQREHSIHSEQVKRLESLFRDGLVSRADLDAAKLELEQDAIRLERAKSKLETAKEAYERERTIAEKGLLNAREVRTAESEVRSAKIEYDRAVAGEQSATAALKNAERAVQNARATYRAYASGGVGNVGRLELQASISGTVTELGATQGESVDRTGQLMVVENLDAVWVTANLPERQAALVKKGDRVTVRTASAPGKTFDGIVQVIGGRIDPETRTLPVQCLVTGSGGALKPEMFATVSIAVGEPKEAVAVPTSAIVEEDGMRFVFVESGGKFERLEVKTDGEQDGFVAVLSGLREGERIAVEGAFVISSELKKSELKGHED
jgi:RND family efflux transporter MFP subunit